MSTYVVCLILLVVFLGIMSVDDAQIGLAMLTFGVTIPITFVAINLLPPMLLAYPSMMVGRVFGTLAGWGVFALLMAALIIGPGLMRRQHAAAAFDGLQTVPPQAVVSGRTIQLDYPEGYVAHMWSAGKLSSGVNFFRRQPAVKVACDDLCAALLDREGVEWVQITQPGTSPRRLGRGVDPGPKIISLPVDAALADVTMTLIDRIYPENDRKVLQIWSGVQRKAVLTVTDHLDGNRTKLDRTFATYWGADDFIFFTPTLASSLGHSGPPWDWASRQFSNDPNAAPDLMAELSAIGLPLASQQSRTPDPQGELALDQALIEDLLTKPITMTQGPLGDVYPEPFTSEDYSLISQFLDRFNETTPPAAAVDLAQRLFRDPRQSEKRAARILDSLARTDQAVAFVADLLATEQAGRIKWKRFNYFAGMDGAQIRAVWRRLDTDIGLEPLFQNATNRQRVLYLRYVKYMDGDPLRLVQMALNLDLSTDRSSRAADEDIRENDVISAALSAIPALPPETHGPAIAIIARWLDRNIDRSRPLQKTCHRLVNGALRTMDEIGGRDQADLFVEKHKLDCKR